MIQPLWLQVVHETNISNTVQGIRRPIKYLRNFAIDGTIPTPSDWLSCLIERGQGILKTNIRRILGV